MRVRFSKDQSAKRWTTALIGVLISALEHHLIKLLAIGKHCLGLSLHIPRHDLKAAFVVDGGWTVPDAV